MANHRQDEFKMDLQLFAEGDLVDPLSDPMEPPAEPLENDSPSGPTADPPADPAPTEPPIDPLPQSIKVKYNHQELDLPYEEAVQHIQKGMNYDKAIERARQEAATEAAQKARDSWIAEQGYEWKGKPIKTEAEYKQALKEQELENKLRAQYANVPDELVQEIIEGKRFREESLAEKKAREESERKAQVEKDFQARQSAMYNEFFQEFPDYDTEEKWKTVPKEVWAEAHKWLETGGREGRRLADALTRHNWRQSIIQQQINQANQANEEASTGSVETKGAPKGALTEEMVESMSPQELAARWPEVKKLFKMK